MNEKFLGRSRDPKFDSPPKLSREGRSAVLQLDITDPRWVDFVRSCRSATPFHHPSWSQLLADCYGFRAFALALTKPPSGLISAGLPTIEVRRPFGRRRWISLPFTDHCPPLLDLEGGTQTHLIAALQRERLKSGVGEIQVRGDLQSGDARTRVGAVRHILPLARDPDVVFASLKESNRRNIRAASRKGLTVGQGRDRKDLTEAFYSLHLQTRHRQGVPVQPRRFFDLFWTQIIQPGLGFLLLAYFKGRPVAGALFLTWNGTMIYKYAASDPQYWGLRPNNLVSWEAIRFGCESGYREFDFGGTSVGNTGLRNFKSQWGTTEEPIVITSITGSSKQDRSPREVGKVASTLISRSPPWVCRSLGELLYKYAA